MNIGTVVIITNTSVVMATLLATLYRIKIEREQIRTIKRNLTAKECLDSLSNCVRAERKSLGSIEKKDLKDFFDYLENLGKILIYRFSTRVRILNFTSFSQLIKRNH